jgi:cyclopropane fatty-acyl-phospholipid synthase-like methyltransferase
MLCGGDDSRVCFEKQGREFLQCCDCGLMWIDPLPSRDEVEERYRTAYSSGEYAAFAEAHATRTLVSSYRLERVLEVAQPGRWLDVGCSTGSFVAAAVSAGCVAEGLDISREAVEIAREAGLLAHHGRVEDFQPTQPYDTITAFDVLEHSAEPRAFVKRLRGWLRPGGKLILTLPDVSSVYPRVLMGRHWFYYWPDEHLFYFDPDTVSRLLREEGFEVKKIARSHKPLSLDYAARNLENFNRGLGRVARAAVSLLPDRLATRPLRLYLGEMFVVARAVAAPSGAAEQAGGARSRGE